MLLWFVCTDFDPFTTLLHKDCIPISTYYVNWSIYQFIFYQLFYVPQIMYGFCTNSKHTSIFYCSRCSGCSKLIALDPRLTFLTKIFLCIFFTIDIIHTADILVLIEYTVFNNYYSIISNYNWRLSSSVHLHGRGFWFSFLSCTAFNNIIDFLIRSWSVCS